MEWLSKMRQQGFFKSFFILAVILTVSGGLAAGGAVVWAERFQGKIGPNVFIGGVEVSRTTPESARRRVQKRVDEIVTDGVRVRFRSEELTLPLSTLISSDLVDDARFNVEAAVADALAAGTSPSPLWRTLKLLHNLLQPTRITVPVAITQSNIVKSLQRLFPEAEQPVVDASFAFKKTAEGWQAEIGEPRNGLSFEVNPFVTELQATLERLETKTITVERMEIKPAINRETAQSAAETALTILNGGPAILTFVNAGQTREWKITEEKVATVLKPGNVFSSIIEIDQEKFDEILDPIAKEVEIEPQNARFQIEAGRVKEFAEGRAGLILDRKKIATDLLTLLMQGGERKLALATKEAEPTVKTEDVNDLGIKETLGVGTSSFKGSPGNRIRNIRNGVRLLNGLIIPPGETFSLLAALKPFNEGNGYLPELVIKGDKIVPELGGGLCQIGTTTFRTAMNSGLPIVERSNHSLVVSYYNDPGNGNPGTDATIYEPAPDLKFTNDTGNFVLFQAQMLETKQQLVFTFWGTQDGRDGSYTPPKVLRWIPVPEKVVTETADMAPGEEKCQGAHIGADAIFTYTIKRPDGTVEDKVFTSHYRPLPEICLKGVAAEPNAEGSITEEEPTQ